jgi:hypothetical protein
LTVCLGRFKWRYEGLMAFQIAHARGEVTHASFADATVQSKESPPSGAAGQLHSSPNRSKIVQEARSHGVLNIYH